MIVVDTGPLVAAVLSGDDDHREADFVYSLAAGDFAVADCEGVLQRIAELMDTYADLPLGLADASVVAIAEEIGAREIATLDRRDFSVVRPRHVNSFTLLP